MSKTGGAKTVAARLLDAAGIEYELLHYDLGGEAFSAEAVAAAIGLAPEQVFKTLVAIGDRTGPMFAVVPAGTQLDTRRLAAVSGDRKVELAPVRDVRALTGYPRGSVTVLGARKPYPVWLDEIAAIQPRIGVSGGGPGVELLLDPTDYQAVTGAKLADIAR